MRLVTYSYKNRASSPGVLEGDTIRPVTWPADVRTIVQRGVTPSTAPQRIPLDEVRLLAPLRPPKIVAIGKNYSEHANEMGSDAPERPLIFSIFPSAVIGTNDPITWREDITTEVDWEVELAVIIGKRAKAVGEDDALDFVFGYTVANDVTARDLQKKIDKQWTRGKSLDTFCPLGPVIVTRDEIDDPQALHLTTKVNDEVMQDANTKDMIFSVRKLISYCSQSFVLEPGDVLMTGTPSGVGAGRKPPVFLKDGDTVEVSIDGIGTLTNPCVVEATPEPEAEAEAAATE